MSLPPFPPQDLAKLVLGYLLEEQLMTAYDEFLQASPYLDALINEYDRIFMTSLKHILAEYRAIKICVETCKPSLLRRRLFQCSSLLDIFKFLIAHIDLAKINNQETPPENSRVEAYDSSNEFKPKINCEVCNSLKLNVCSCKTRQSSFQYCSSSQIDVPLTTLVETTPLSELPGNQVMKKQVKILEKDINNSTSSSSLVLQVDTSYKKDSCSSNNTQFCHDLLSSSVNGQQTVMQPKPGDTDTPNEISNTASSDNQTRLKSDKTCKKSSRKRSTKGKDASNIKTIPDSSTSDNVMLLSPKPNEDIIPGEKSDFNNTQTNLNSLGSNEIILSTPKSCRPFRSKPEDHKITIISDIRMENSNDKYQMPKVLKTITPPPKLKSIVINGTPAYKKPTLQSYNFTKDEIMAMPTIILVPATVPSQTRAITQSAVAESQNHCQNNIAVETNRTCPSFEPLTIDITNSPDENIIAGSKIDVTEIASQKKPVDSLIKIVNKVATVPKDIPVPTTSTPQVLPPLRKSSSTPRRSSHVRVLDFTTPRRILSETNEITSNVITIDDQAVQNTPIPLNNVLNSGSTHMAKNSASTTQPNLNTNDYQIGNINKPKPKSSNWDADLRAHISFSENVVDTAPKRKTKTTRKKKSVDSKAQKKPANQSSKKVKKSESKRKVLSKNTKNKKESDITTDSNEGTIPETVEKSIRPTINIIPRKEWSTTINKESKCQGTEKSHEETDTPEAERQALQNAIGVKLNISDILETPYKQAIYDIQMETPRFLDSDIMTPNTPFSDIKIMNIPTPRFLEEPNLCQPAQATPSSYSSRPTDYSSSGSYYKPDDQDYFPTSESLGCLSILPVEPPKASTSSVLQSKEDEQYESKARRPVRRCTKNVSYYNSPNLKSKVDNIDHVSPTVIDTDSEKQDDKENISKGSKNKLKGKIDKVSTVKKYKSPVKKENKAFIKVKSRFTPTKRNHYGKMKGKSSDSFNNASSKSLSRKKSTSKEINTSVAPVVVPVQTKSRRKSSTPRKLQCTKTYNNGVNIEKNSSGGNIDNLNPGVGAQDSDAEQLPLRWSDDGSQESKAKESKIKNSPVENAEDIYKIQDYIQNELNKDTTADINAEQIIVNKQFDSESAKLIERDLLDTPPLHSGATQVVKEQDKEAVSSMSANEKSNDNSTTNFSVEATEDEDIGIDFSVYDSNPNEGNYVYHSYNYEMCSSQSEPVTLKDKYSIEICIDDGVSIRLRVTPFSLLINEDCNDTNLLSFNQQEMDMAVSSISNIDKLYTPLKDSYKDQCYNIFDSTLTSLDTPLKPNGSPQRKQKDSSVAEIILEVEPINEEKSECRDKIENKGKRKRIHSALGSDDSLGDIKRVRSETQYLLNSANIQNMDIESVLSKLHGP